jgi:prolyl-tRNA editing enzyme YbaK/EbsC (Cys-tRNA(Pro) deacylase)
VSEPLSPAAQRVQDALRAAGFDYQVVESDQPTRTAAEAARLVGCQVGQIAKSLVFRTKQSGRGVLVITSGANQVNEWRVGVLLKEALETFIDQDLMTHAEIWAAAGTPHALFRLTPADLVRMSGGRVIRVT